LNSMWPFSLSSFKSSLMLSVLLSVEELELLVIPYCNVFENHLHFSLLLLLSCPSTSYYYHQAMVPILHRIIITDFHPVLVAASSSIVFFFYFLNRTCNELGFWLEKPDSLYPCDSPWISSYHVQNSLQYNIISIQR
jgi:hypothetical protein